MNIIKVNVNFKNRTIYKQGVDLTSGDYNSTKLIFEFDRQDGRKVFEMKDPDGNLVLLTDIVNNEVILVGKDENGNNVSLFNQPNDYIFEISLYDGESKLTSASDRIKIKQEEVIVDGEVITAYLPIFDKLINEVENLNVEVDGNILTITKKDGTKESTNIQGPQGKPGSVKTIPVNEFPTENIEEDAIYILPNPNPTSEKDKYQEFVYVNGGWELFGGGSVGVDLTDYVKKDDFAGGAYGVNVRSNGVVGINPANTTLIDEKTNAYRPIVPSNLDYAVGSVKASETQSGTIKAWVSINEDGEIGLNISTEV
ncbi:MAG: hypothetical protein IKL65_00315 [Bacilli bacterium]|nr:hypothetical protein [Bacilli bacterium]